MLDPEVEAILCARGGYGALRIVDALPWDAFCAAPKWIVGFSDVTALHVAANARGIATVHAANASGWGRSTPTVTAERHELLAALEAFARSPWTHLERLHSGPVARGPLVGGNLSLLAAMAAANQLRIPPSAILAFEDVTERPYRLDRILMSLRLGGYFENVAALVLGSFTACDAGPDEVTARQVFEGLTADLGIAVVAGAPFGHGPRNAPFVTGGVATLLGTTLTFA